ncbi:hypothetical protein GZ77_08315 [Endozoicomonas montiporae]|uniref:Uncharacterized protein n=2 Tax=Endozoicomonas montiporae TaxID=1027273 RepID=A0A081N7F4_9GAMM|nr:hypothetical protein [Endozoicomonas montiporae]AMO55781.1 hypothetical protein EZMO1_1626 [Endozoicomonas montiporae CL-33]KEQ14377.1 hypothetical protein GZ77_08315 [Endozoicomonas montiporae]
MSACPPVVVKLVDSNSAIEQPLTGIAFNQQYPILATSKGSTVAFYDTALFESQIPTNTVSVEPFETLDIEQLSKHRSKKYGDHYGEIQQIGFSDDGRLLMVYFDSGVLELYGFNYIRPVADAVHEEPVTTIQSDEIVTTRQVSSGLSLSGYTVFTFMVSALASAYLSLHQ